MKNVHLIKIFVTLFILWFFGHQIGCTYKSRSDGSKSETVPPGSIPKQVLDEDKKVNPSDPSKGTPPNPELCKQGVKEILGGLPKVSFSSAWEKRSWLIKVSKLLRAGKELSRAELNLWEGKTTEEYLEYLLSLPEFGDSILDFNLFFLGFRGDSIRNPATGKLEFEVLGNAVDSAVQVSQDGNYLSLFEYNHPFYMLALSKPFGDGPGDDKKDDKTLRKEMERKYLDFLDQQITFVK